ncbi:MAG: hypothetical protein M9894_25670 [Planctomycetes bacterium]|nr:hypothetical protein [Planctomycetota bacterium]
MTAAAAAQMAALLATARAGAGASHGRCLEALQRNVLAAGGYGGLLDLFARHEGAWRYQAAALGLARAIDDAGGPAAVGLERLDLLPPDAPPGALLLTRGTGHAACPIDPRVGDVSVIDGVAGGTLARPLRRLRGTGEHVHVLETTADPGHAPRCRVARAAGPVDPGPPGPTLGWVARDALEDVPRALVAWNDARVLLPADRAAWRSAAWAGAVVGVFAPAVRAT